MALGDVAVAVLGELLTFPNLNNSLIPSLCCVCSSLFPDVVNCMQTDNLELKKLVYLYLMNYAKSQPDMAIMAVNSFVKVTCSPGTSGKGPAQCLPAHLCPLGALSLLWGWAHRGGC